MRGSSKLLGAVVLLLVVVCALLWSAVLQLGEGNTLTVSFINAGKGSAVLIKAPSGRTVLIDGGPDASILRALGTSLPWWQKSIDVVIAAHPDAAHATGLIDVLQRYKVARAIVSSAPGSGPVMQTFGKTLADARARGTLVQPATRGQVLDLGGGASIEILFPDRPLSGASASDACIEMLLLYGNTSFMLSCGASATEKYLVELDGTNVHADVLSANDGAATSSALFAGFVGAQYAAHTGETYVSDGEVISRN